MYVKSFVNGKNPTMTMIKHTTSHLQKLRLILWNKGIGIPQLLDSHRM